MKVYFHSFHLVFKKVSKDLKNGLPKPIWKIVWYVLADSVTLDQEEKLQHLYLKNLTRT